MEATAARYVKQACVNILHKKSPTQLPGCVYRSLRSVRGIKKSPTKKSARARLASKQFMGVFILRCSATTKITIVLPTRFDAITTENKTLKIVSMVDDISKLFCYLADNSKLLRDLPYGLAHFLNF
ncbi:hypothetical protein OS493_023576 [Desmophyllum pertusum]|uniref:Uncharacterized protein n=1 Tax=Desmophyllum pertusum TaxID=174260 RepID=A0A9X0CXT7_9CNID|nr:hypothetical protein OS493_023576 [Desmophyllum pertusum]